MLGVDRYDNQVRLGDTHGRLALSWTSDERDFLNADLTEAIQRRLSTEPIHVAGSRYLVDDPFGTRALTDAVDQFFGRRIGAVVHAGAGVNALLSAVASMPARKIDVLAATYPDLPHWASRAGRILSRWEPGDVHQRGAIMFLERPNLFEDTADSFATLSHLVAARHAAGGLTVVDESNANYLPPSYSATSLLPDASGLIVLRGISKAYGMGGWRLGLALSSPDAAALLRPSLVPLQASSLSIKVGVEVLQHGDVAASLRDRIKQLKPEVARLVAPHVSSPIITSRLTLPYLFFTDLRAGTELAARGIDTKVHVSWTGDGPREVVRLSVPLAQNRFDRAVDLLRQDA